jgi:hypothetical protein
MADNTGKAVKIRRNGYSVEIDIFGYDHTDVKTILDKLVEKKIIDEVKR